MIVVPTKRFSVFEVCPTLLSRPILLQSKVVKGFGRGAKQLGCPTANLEEDVQGLNEAKEGVYFGWARLNHQDVYECVASVGWNPFFQLDKKTCEPHLLHKFTEDFYGANIELCLCGYIRGEKNFSSLDDLIRAIQWDISVSKVSMTLANFTQANCFKI